MWNETDDGVQSETTDKIKMNYIIVQEDNNIHLVKR
jgi:hypothetical protein